MKTLHTVQNKNTFEIYTENELYASIIFENHAEAILKIGDKTFHIVEGETKNMVLKANNETLFVFEFDKLWGGAKLVSDGTDLGCVLDALDDRGGTLVSA